VIQESGTPARRSGPDPASATTATRSGERLRWMLLADGESVHTRRFAAALVGAGVEVHLAGYGCTEIPGVTHHQLGDRPHRHPRRVARLVLRLRHIVRAVSPDVLNPHYTTGYGLLASLAGHPHVIQTAWGSDLFRDARGVRGSAVSFALRRAWLGMGDSQALLDAIGVRAPSLPRVSFMFGPPAWLLEAPREKEPIVLSPRGHESHYQIDKVLDAWEIARRQLPDHRLVVAATGSLTGRLRSRAGEAVEFVGQLEHDAMLDLMRRSDTMISIPRWDSSSASLLEAMATGCRVLGSDVPAAREWLPPGNRVAVDSSAETVAAALLDVMRSSPMELDPGWTIDRQAVALVQRVRSSL
jgi:glycosyltransferase involved in cell wall biosynthesis